MECMGTQAHGPLSRKAFEETLPVEEVVHNVQHNSGQDRIAIPAAETGNAV